MKDTSKLCVHTITTKPWSLEEALNNYTQAGVAGISIWRESYQDIGVHNASRLISQYPIEVVSLVRGGFFAHTQKSQRQKSIENNIKLIDEAAALSAPLLVLVCGANPKQPKETSLNQIREGIETLLPYAEKNNVKLGIEPLHPMYADTRSAINTLATANDVCEELRSPYLGTVIDVYHLWWDYHLKEEIKRSAQLSALFAFHICDWKSPTTDLLNDRGLMGEGCIPIKEIRGWVEDEGFSGFHEVEIFSDNYWSMDQNEFLHKITEAYLKHS